MYVGPIILGVAILLVFLGLRLALSQMVTDDPLAVPMPVPAPFPAP